MAAELLPGRAALVRACGADPLIRALVPPQPAWDVPHRVLAAVDYLVVGGEADDYRAEEHGLRARQHPLELALWPGHGRALVGKTAIGGGWLDWWGLP